MLTAIRRRLGGLLTRIGTGRPELQLANALTTYSDVRVYLISTLFHSHTPELR